MVDCIANDLVVVVFVVVVDFSAIFGDNGLL